VWEARLAGPEVMSYGGESGEGFVSDLTLAFLEDLGHYAANYSLAGRLMPASTRELTASMLSLAQIISGEDTVEPEVVGERRELAPGALRWGRGAGCGFVRGPTSDWDSHVAVTANGHEYGRYLCGEDRLETDFGCSYDNRESAVCSVSEWGVSGGSQAPQTRTCFVDPETGLEECESSRSTDGGGVPAEFRVLPGRFGGTNAAMDFAPVRASFWSCLDSDMHEGQASSEDGGGGSFDFSSLFAGQEQSIQAFAGQAHCRNCRCFVSSLMGVKTMNPAFPRYGLCYPSNCWREDRLQVGIVKTGGFVHWYDLPGRWRESSRTRLSWRRLLPARGGVLRL